MPVRKIAAGTPAPITLNMTPTRVSLLRFLLKHGQVHPGSYMMDKIAPRLSLSGRNVGWRPQGATRAAWGLLAPLEKAGIVKSIFRRYHSDDVVLTEAGRAFAEHVCSQHANQTD